MKKNNNTIKNRVKIKKNIEKELNKKKKLKKSISITIDEDLLALVTQISINQNISISGIICRLISVYLSNSEDIKFRVGKKKPE